MQVVAGGTLRKMSARLESPVSYQMRLGEVSVPLNPLLEQPIRLRHTGAIHCVHCGRQTRKSFNQGYCWPCFQSLAECDSCIIHPERCHYEQGTCRQPAWGEQHCLQDHIVYLANSSGLKVGITRATQVPTRWIDQGAVQALALIRVRSRLQSGQLEVMFKQHVADKTNWRDMLGPSSEVLDLPAEGRRLLDACATDLQDIRARHGDLAVSVLNGIDVVRIEYPVRRLPATLDAITFDKTPDVSGVLLGIKGQYLILDGGVINLRRHAGYHIELLN